METLHTALAQTIAIFSSAAPILLRTLLSYLANSDLDMDGGSREPRKRRWRRKRGYSCA